MPDAIPEAAAAGSHSHHVFQPVAERAGLTVQDLLVQATDRTLLKRFPTLADVANTAAFLASDHASAITGTVANLTCGTIVD
jgi:enoyl-[acyl-carrier-protein] reductase (NADH)